MAGELDPRTRKEVFLSGMLYGDPEDLPDPETRDELFMKAIAETIKEGGVPSPEGADVGDVLTIGADGPEWAAVPQELPDQTGASVGDVLTIGSDGPEWTAPSGGAEVWQHQVFITLVSTSVTELNSKVLECFFISNSETFTLETGPRQYATHVFATDTIFGSINVLNQTGGTINVFYGSGGTGNITTSGGTGHYTVSYGNNLKLI